VKVQIKPKAEAQERITLRIPASLKKRMDETRAIADKLGADYYASIIDAISGADEELRTKLIQAGAKVGDKTGDRSGDRSGDKSSTSNGSDPDRA
jgi:hypothetical protein